jgi:CheY-like chemotaxis protein
MKDLAALVSALSSLLWPMIVAVFLLVLRPAVVDLVNSAKRRKFTIKVGGQELTMDEANEQQQQLIADLQAQVIDLKNKLNLGRPISEEKTIRESVDENVFEPVVLWVDDEPKNNSYLVQQLVQAGVQVDTALSTAEGLDLFRKGNYSLIVSDMGRKEAGGFNPRAGIELLKTIRKFNPTVPFVIFTSTRGYQESRETAMSFGATDITSSTTELAGILRSAFGGGPRNF